MKPGKSIALLMCLALVGCTVTCGERPSRKGAAHTGKDLPEFSLEDPRGKTFTREDVLENGAVFVVTAPILSNKRRQEGWARYLKATKHRGKGRLVFLQDMSPSHFKRAALSQMEKQSDPDADPLLLIDPEGEMRSKLGVEREDTIVLVFDKNGRCVHEERGKPSEKSASRIWGALG